MHKNRTPDILTDVQRAVAELVATSSVGYRLLLIGGFRYRFLDHSARLSRDIDYHWAGDLEQKRDDLLDVFKKRLLPAIRRRYGFDGSVQPATGPAADSAAVRTVEIAFWKAGVPYSRIEIPVEITRVSCADPSEVRTVNGVVYPTLSDADQVESKLLAVHGRAFLQHRDLVDIFLFADRLRPDSPRRLDDKLREQGLSRADVRRRLDDLGRHAAYHVKAIQAVIDGQLDRVAADNIQAAGGASMIWRRVVAILESQFSPVETK